jgi:hypothetical protein
LKPADYDQCLDNYTSEEFDHIDLVPPALKQRVYDQGDVATRAAFLKKQPEGYRAYISTRIPTSSRTISSRKDTN